MDPTISKTSSSNLAKEIKCSKPPYHKWNKSSKYPTQAATPKETPKPEPTINKILDSCPIDTIGTPDYLSNKIKIPETDKLKVIGHFTIYPNAHIPNLTDLTTAPNPQ